jgi:aspartyl-tRNA(Asn)/glutamyl-tRNA(Gln) amidotransferase subunit A
LGLNEKTLHELVQLLTAKEIDIGDLIDDLYAAIELMESQVNAFLSIAEKEKLRKEASGFDDKLLRGIPIAIKDLISTVNFTTTCGSQFLRDFQPTFDATAVKKLKLAGASIQGKTNLDEFGMGSSNENSGFGPTKNPIDLDRVPGGSSGGSAAAVAANTAICALGTDTGGSVRLPAAFCGVVGLKPTYGLVSRYGLIAYASSLDQIGPITKDVRDSAILLDILAGHDPLDSTSAESEEINYVDCLSTEITGLKIGYVREFVEMLDDEAEALFGNWRKTFESLGAEFVELSLPHCNFAIPTYYLLSSAEASANLARYDGVRFSHRASDESVDEMYSVSRSEGFGPEVKRRIMLGTYGLASGYYDAWYKKSQKVRALIKSDFDEAFRRVDVILTPTSPTPAFRLGEKMDDPLDMYLTDQFLVPASLAGICAISVPGGLVEGLPFGMQLMGDRFQEGKILSAAHAFELTQK